MRRRTTVVAIEFECRDWNNGFYVVLRIPYSVYNWQAVFAIRGAANIKKIREPL